MNAEKLVANDAIRALVRNGGIPGARAVLRQTLMRVLAPPWKRRRMRLQVRGYLKTYFPEYDRRTAEALSHAYVWHWVTKHADDCITINLSDPRFALDQFERHFFYEQPHLLRESVERGRGVLLVGAHMGSVTLGTIGALAKLLEIPQNESPAVRICADPEIRNYPSVFEGLDRCLAELGRDMNIVVTRRNAKSIAATMAEGLARGDVVTTNLDVMMGGRNRTPFLMFGKARVRLPALVGAAKVALRSGATILPWLALHAGPKLRIRYENPIVVDKLEDEVSDAHPAVAELSVKLRDVLQGWIRWHPEQWTYWDRFDKRVVS